jgi:hypothetical protein
MMAQKPTRARGVIRERHFLRHHDGVVGVKPGQEDADQREIDPVETTHFGWRIVADARNRVAPSDAAWQSIKQQA